MSFHHPVRSWALSRIPSVWCSSAVLVLHQTFMSCKYTECDAFFSLSYPVRLPHCCLPGSNLTIQVLHSTLEELAKTAEANGKSLPRKLHLQLDNCSRENKNK